MMEKIKEYYYTKICGRKIDLMLRFIIMAVTDIVLLYIFSFMQDGLYDVGIEVAYSYGSAIVIIFLWVFYTLVFGVIAFNDYVNFSRIDKILFKK